MLSSRVRLWSNTTQIVDRMCSLFSSQLPLHATAVCPSPLLIGDGFHAKPSLPPSFHLS